MKPLYPNNPNIQQGDVFITTIEGYDIYKRVDGDTRARNAANGYPKHSYFLPKKARDFMEAYENLLS